MRKVQRFVFVSFKMTQESWDCREVSLPDFFILLLTPVKGYWLKVISAATTLIFYQIFSQVALLIMQAPD